jgi:hypothetical protein
VFEPGISLEQIQSNWTTDLLSIRGVYESRPNMGYYMPFFRIDNCSHCATIPPLAKDETTIARQPWLGTEIASEQLNLRDFIDQLLDNTQPVAREFESDATQDFTEEQAAMCLPKG